eukprot:GHVR01119357.1.p1 GENE.GHVR01119357.1~~GHVR01119357.1.p1  ORF type:complete len:499 (+),score=112.73 GHVR01119357.1:150-1646(+)
MMNARDFPPSHGTTPSHNNLPPSHTHLPPSHNHLPPSHGTTPSHAHLAPSRFISTERQSGFFRLGSPQLSPQANHLAPSDSIYGASARNLFHKGLTQLPPSGDDRRGTQQSKYIHNKYSKQRTLDSAGVSITSNFNRTSAVSASRHTQRTKRLSFYPQGGSMGGPMGGSATNSILSSRGVSPFAMRSQRSVLKQGRSTKTLSRFGTRVNSLAGRSDANNGYYTDDKTRRLLKAERRVKELIEEIELVNTEYDKQQAYIEACSRQRVEAAKKIQSLEDERSLSRTAQLRLDIEESEKERLRKQVILMENEINNLRAALDNNDNDDASDSESEGQTEGKVEMYKKAQSRALLQSSCNSELERKKEDFEQKLAAEMMRVGIEAEVLKAQNNALKFELEASKNSLLEMEHVLVLQSSNNKPSTGYSCLANEIAKATAEFESIWTGTIDDTEDSMSVASEPARLRGCGESSQVSFHSQYAHTTHLINHTPHIHTHRICTLQLV